MIPVNERVFVKVDTEKKNQHTFENGQTIHLERNWNNLNKRETQPVNAIVLNAGNLDIPVGSEVVIHHNSVHPVNRVFNYVSALEDASSTIQYYSIPSTEVFIYREQGSEEWKPVYGYIIGERVFEPYFGLIEGILPKQLPDILYITKGALSGKVVKTLKHCDYEMVFQGVDNREERLIRCRHYPDQSHDREEVVCICHDLTKKVKKGLLYIGLTPETAHPL